jgi:predicted transcriptional regulator
MLKLITRVTLALTLSLILFYSIYSFFQPINKQFASIVAYGLFLSSPIPILLVFYNKTNWAKKVFVGSWLVYISIVFAVALWETFELLLLQNLGSILIFGSLVLAVSFFTLYKTDKLLKLFNYVAKLKGNKPETKKELYALENNKEPPEEPVEHEFLASKRSEGASFDLDQQISSLDVLECSIVQKLIKDGAISSKKDLQQATNASYKRILSSVKRLKEAGLIEVKKQIIRGKKGAVVRHTIELSPKLQLEKTRVESLIKKRLKQLEKWGFSSFEQ